MATSTITIIDGASTVTLDNTVSIITLGNSGPQGAPGEGVPVGGTAGQILAKDTATDYDTSWIDNYTTDVRKYVKNNSGSTLAKGTVVYVSGANGANVLVKPALATADGTSATTIGFLNETLANNGQGYAIVEGTISGIDTSAATAGDPVWLSGSVAGGVLYGVANKPQAPVHIVYLGTVTRAHANQGQIEISVNNGWELDELHNVAITSPSDGQVLTYNAASSLWVNSSESGDISAVNVTSPITGGGTSGAVTIGHADSGVSAAYYGGAGIIPTFTVDAKGHLTSAVNVSASITASQISDGASTFARLGAANAFTVGGHTITNTVAATVPLQITGAASQSGDMLNVSSSAGTSLFKINSTGTLLMGSGLGVATDYVISRGLTTGAYLQTSSTHMYAMTRAATNKGLVIQGAASQSANLQEWQASNGAISALVDAYGSAAFGGNNVLGSSLGVQTAGSASQKGIVVRGAAAQTANLQEWQSSASSILSRVDSSGIIYGQQVRTISSYVLLGEANSGGRVTLTRSTAAVTNPGANSGSLYFRDGTTAGTLKLVVRAGAAGAETTILDNIPQ